MFKGIKKLVILLLTFSLTACVYKTHSANPSDYENKAITLSNDMVLAETKPINPLMAGRYWLFSFTKAPYNNNYLNLRMPTYDQYKSDPDYWHKWKGSPLVGYSRLTDIVAAGTRIRIIDIAPTGQGGYWVTVEIESGKYKGTQALYGDPKSITPGLYL